jgi:hypothetical protein
MSELVAGLFTRSAFEAGGRLGRPGSQATAEPCRTVKEGARGGTTGSPTPQNARDVRFLDV